MRPLILIFSFLFTLVPTAYGGTSQSEPIQFIADQEVFRTKATDTGWLPHPLSPFAVRFQADSSGSIYVDQYATSTLTWPEAFAQRWEGIRKGGLYVMQMYSTLKADLRVNWDDTYINETIWENSFDWSVRGEFDSLLLPHTKHPEIYTEQHGETEVIGANLFDGDIAVNVYAEFTPETRVQLHAVGLHTQNGRYVPEDNQAFVSPPEKNTGEMDLQSTWSGNLEGELAMLFTGRLEVSVGGWTFDLKRFDDRWLLGKESTPIVATANYTHPLPCIDLDTQTLNFGRVVIGEQKQLEINIQNLGDIRLDGLAETLDGQDFWVSRDRIKVDDQQSLEVVFAPIGEGMFEDVIVLSTNDPIRPLVEIRVQGTGVLAPEHGGQIEAGCGCNAPVPMAPAGILISSLFALFLRRRRQ